MKELSDKEIKDYTSGFNQGYQFANALPSVTPKMFANMPESSKEKPRVQGMLDGISQKHKERFISQQKEKAPSKANQPTKDKGSPSINR